MKWNSNLYDDSHGFVSKYGHEMLSWLKPQKNETILDLGCGTGDLSYEISQQGAKVTGIDNSQEMISKAKSKYPNINFEKVDIQKLPYKSKFDAIFSNAVLHWVPEKEIAVDEMYKSLKKGGRIVLEFGGHGCVEKLRSALKNSLIKRNFKDNANIALWYFPTIGEYSTVLEKKGFRVTNAELFNRPTPLRGENGIKNWYKMFCDNYFYGISQDTKDEILSEVRNNLKASCLIDGIWIADYVRVRFFATKE